MILHKITAFRWRVLRQWCADVTSNWANMHKASIKEGNEKVVRRIKTTKWDGEIDLKVWQFVWISAMQTAPRVMDLTIHDRGTGETEVRD